jgi:hypothetical protein
MVPHRLDDLAHIKIFHAQFKQAKINIDKKNIYTRSVH